MSGLFHHHEPAFPIRCLHLDLKGLPPTAKRLAELPAVIRAAGYNALLVEWEDMFPWTVHAGLRNETAYTPDEVETFCNRAAELGLEIIPLVQCLGHMETPLSLPQYRHLRETPDNCSDLDPLAPGARELVMAMVEDVLRLTQQVRYFHLGGDESGLGTNAGTRAFIEEHGKGALYLHHVEPMLDSFKARGIRPLLWHDMMLDWDETALKWLGAKADLCAWGYRGHPDRVEGHWNSRHVQRFHDCGVPLWCATAYKCGSDGEADYVAHIEDQAENALGWCEVGKRVEAKGIIATGWSRNSTGGKQYVPIDAALDSLFIIGAILHDGEAHPAKTDTVFPALQAIGERERFEACHAVARELTAVRNEGWHAVRTVYEKVAVSTTDCRRRSDRLYDSLMNWFDDVVDRSDAIADRFRLAFDGAIPPLWIERYLAERLMPIRELHALLQARGYGIRDMWPVHSQGSFSGRGS